MNIKKTFSILPAGLALMLGISSSNVAAEIGLVDWMFTETTTGNAYLLVAKVGGLICLQIPDPATLGALQATVSAAAVLATAKTTNHLVEMTCPIARNLTVRIN